MVVKELKLELEKYANGSIIFCLLVGLPFTKPGHALIQDFSKPKKTRIRHKVGINTSGQIFNNICHSHSPTIKGTRWICCSDKQIFS